MRHKRFLAPLISLVSLLAACSDARVQPLFRLLDADRTGVSFANTITTSDSLNLQTNPYVYNGAGVAVGDVDNDGLPDLFFAGNMVTSRLYLNRGEMRFDDITTAAGVMTTRWATGATMVDINADGFLDIYVSVSPPSWSKPEQRANLLFINNGNRTFTESAEQYGIAHRGFTTHAAFLDYDGDGCLDLFLLENSPADFSRADVGGLPHGMTARTPDSENQLYRNSCRGTFTNTSAEAGILREAGYGLGVAVSDLNGDGWPDIYVSNDVVPNDVLYMNDGDGTFTNKAARSIKHASVAGMGVDIADFNNDGWPDIVQADMMPRELSRRKRTSGFATHATQQNVRGRGFRDDYSVNSLQMSNGITPQGDVVFSEISRMAGVSHTDWSWSTLFADFDNDGHKDLFVGNGYPKAANDLDYMASIRSSGGNEASRRAARENLTRLPAYHEPNYLFRNAGDLTFADVTARWGMSQPSFSYGAAYADLDNDGRLDLVVNNIDAPAFIYHNVQPKDELHHYLRVRLDGTGANRRGIGATLVLTAGGKKQHLYASPYRGYMSTVEDRAHFGIGAATRVDSLEVFWPDGQYQLLTGIAADTTVVVQQARATERRKVAHPAAGADRRFAPAAPGRFPAYVHKVGGTIDYTAQPLLPYMVGRQGPAVAVHDVDADGLDDVFVGGTPDIAGQLFLQKADGRFVASAPGQPWDSDRGYEAWGALFFDANGDKRPDLYVASGGYLVSTTSPALQDRLYLNQGGGRFVRDSTALPSMPTSTATVRAGDFTGDGKTDLFVGGRLSPRNYPYPVRSYLLRNDGGRFTDVTEQLAPELVKPGGMITDAVWTDFDGDGRLDLVTAGEWMPIQFHRNDGTRLRDVTSSMGLPPSRGWWSSLATGDFDGDGRADLVAGNLGLNYSYRTSKDSVFGLYAGDFGGNQTTSIVLTQETKDAVFPLAGFEPLGRELYQLGIKFPTHGSFAAATMSQLFGEETLKQALQYRVDTFASLFLRNAGGGKFSVAPLPSLAQIAPIRAIIPHDVDGDGRLDLIMGGNLYDAEANTPRADAGNGLWLRGDGKGGFTPVSPRESGFLAPRNVSGLALVASPSGRMVLVANTGDTLQAFTLRK